ncbi:MAG: tRNA threonylcarbamoyladenosine dehydratase [Muribaculaceae bacterium]|nr:tRNA threonylcarbamoyladenosine dehydratase [Muribaculaceae bacterium]
MESIREEKAATGPSLVFNRTERLVGESGMEALSRARVIIFGVGGVGSWTAEALARTGIGHITIVDADKVSPTNINRQAEADLTTVGQVKVEAMKRQLLSVAPGIEVEALEMEYNSQTADSFDFEEYDFVIDAIDSLAAKALLIRNATAARRPVVYSSMGAALKLDPTKIAVAEFWKVQGCPLAAALRRKFKKSGEFPRRKFRCVYSPELLDNRGAASAEDPSMGFNKVAVNGSLCHITAIFGMMLAGMVVERIVEDCVK